MNKSSGWPSGQPLLLLLVVSMPVTLLA